MRLKKVKKTKNEYVFAGGVWVRNFCKPDAQSVLENNMLSKKDIDTVLHNERSNRTLQLGMISDESFYFPKVVIVSDGYDFQRKIECLRLFPDKDICVLAVNKALKLWPLVGVENPRSINFYVVNNPYDEASYFLPQRYFPACIGSTRTSYGFMSAYQGMRYFYEPTPERGFGYIKSQMYFIDDYRNPISSALSLAYRLGARKIMMLCCDDSFKEEKPSAVRLSNDLWTYPQHLRSQEILDAQSYWLKQAGIQVANYSSGREYENAVYIKDDDEFKTFFTEEDVI